MDPLFVKWASLAFAMLLILAARHKLVSRAAFRTVLADYRLLPRMFIGPASWLFPSAELLLALAWLATLAGRLPAAVAGVATAALLALYTFAIAANLLRGRHHISCGCSLSAADVGHLSWALVLRNSFQILLALAAATPVTERPLGAGGYTVLAAALVASMFLYLAASQLLRNSTAMSAWRRNRD